YTRSNGGSAALGKVRQAVCRHWSNRSAPPFRSRTRANTSSISGAGALRNRDRKRAWLVKWMRCITLLSQLGRMAYAESRHLPDRIHSIGVDRRGLPEGVEADGDREPALGAAASRHGHAAPGPHARLLAGWR